MGKEHAGIGAVIGDMFGSRYEAAPLPLNGRLIRLPFNRERFLASHKDGAFRKKDLGDFTDDTIHTLAVKRAVLGLREGDDAQVFEERVKDCLICFTEDFPGRGYGARFKKWIREGAPGRGQSIGNGSAMRVSTVAYAGDDLETVDSLATASARSTHNTMEGLKGARAIAEGIFLLRNGASRKEVKESIRRHFGYHLDTEWKKLAYGLGKITRLKNDTCPISVPQAFIAFFAARSFEDTLIRAVSIGGDTDTLAAMAGSLAEAFYGVPDYLIQMAEMKLPPKLRELAGASVGR